MEGYETSLKYNLLLKINLQGKGTQELIYTLLRLYLSIVTYHSTLHLSYIMTNFIDTNPIVVLYLLADSLIY
jgi:hypothetical protein